MRLTPVDSAEDEHLSGWMPINRHTRSHLPEVEQPAVKGAVRTKSNSALRKARVPRTKSKEDVSNVNRKRSGSVLGRVSKRARESGPESPKSTDDGSTFNASIKKLEAFRHHSDSSSYIDRQDLSSVSPQSLVGNPPIIISSDQVSEQRGSLSTAPEPWLLDSSDDPFQFFDFGNNGNKFEPGPASEAADQRFGSSSIQWISLSSDDSSLLGPKPKASFVEKEPQHPFFPDPLDDLEDADFSAVDELPQRVHPLAQQVHPHRPKPTVRPRPQPPRKPIVRPPFPAAVPTRSLVHGVCAATVLRTCFRIGEALRAGSSAVLDSNNNDVVIELYARVASSAREGPGPSGRQTFRFVDLFHDRPPYLKGVYDLWKGSELWDAESRAFLGAEGQPVLCRCVGKMRRDGKELLMTVFNVRTASWDDVDHAKAIICGV